MIFKQILKTFLPALLCAATSLTATADDTEQTPVIDFLNGQSKIMNLPLDSDPTLTTSLTTEWEFDQLSPADANENGHALMYHDGKIYVYTNRYVQGAKSRHTICAFNASDGSFIEEKDIPFSSMDKLWNGNSLLSHTIGIDEEGNLLFVFGDNNNTPSLTLVHYAFDTNSAVIFREIKVANESLKYNLNASSLGLSDAVINGSIGADFTLLVNIFVKQTGSSQQDIRSVPLTIKCESNNVTAMRQRQHSTIQEYHNYHSDLSDLEYKISSICEIDENHILASHNPAAFKLTNNIDKFSLFCDSKSGYCNFKDNWSDENLMPVSGDNCLGMYVVKHNGHNILVYAKSYVRECVFNAVLWDDPSSFDNMKLLGQIKVPGKIEASDVYKEGIRQMVVQEPKTAAPSENPSESRVSTEDSSEQTTFYTYAPGAALAKHTIETKVKTIPTSISEVAAEPNIRLVGKTLIVCDHSPVTICTPSGSLVAEYHAATAIDLSLLPSGIYIIKSGKSAIKAAL